MEPKSEMSLLHTERSSGVSDVVFLRNGISILCRSHFCTYVFVLWKIFPGSSEESMRKRVLSKRTNKVPHLVPDEGW